ncbi:hypothetical protein PDM99_13605 [Bacillus cereus group sp. Bc200]|uniref:hypothetical protein n=1 Tax=unclassified Bacillus cereus group TaxID=2750818 RepID=UPI0022E59CD3|nr:MULTISPECIES: hypothetical protein [unclassified Bacillus cereus group]MDA2261317.1 hypothetical protein [Bacillus cereus group sp. Bc200]MDA2322016.1 hypothetical protein [Bacillus cereus group sp. Bc177]
MRIKVIATSQKLSMYELVLKEFDYDAISNDGETDYTYITINKIDELLRFKDAVKRDYEMYGELIITNDQDTAEPLIEIYDFYSEK